MIYLFLYLKASIMRQTDILIGRHTHRQIERNKDPNHRENEKNTGKLETVCSFSFV